MIKIVFFFLLVRSVLSLEFKKIDFEVDYENIEEDVKKLYTILRPGIKLADIETATFKAGKSNSVIKLDDPKSRHAIVVRTYYGKISQRATQNITKSLEDESKRIELAVIIKASELNITARLIATFKNGLIIEYIDGDTVDLKTFDKETVRETARRVARFHTIKLDIPIRERPLLNRDVGKYEESKFAAKEFDKFDKLAKELEGQIPSLLELQEEMQDLDDILTRKNAQGDIVFCHNDLSLTNMLIENETRTPFLIDFETSNTNYQYHDFAHLFIRFSAFLGIKFEPENLPNRDYIKDFLESYFEEYNKLNNIQMIDQFDEFLDREAVKIEAFMLLERLLVIRNHFYSDIVFFEGKNDVSRASTINCYIPMYKNYLETKEKVLKELDSIDTCSFTRSDRSNSATGVFTGAFSICLILIGHWLIEQILYEKF